MQQGECPRHLLVALQPGTSPCLDTSTAFASNAVKMLSKTPTTAARCTSSTSTSIRRQLQPIAAPRRSLVVADAALKETAAVPVMEKGELSVFPEQPAVYAVYNQDGQVQYIGLTRKVSSYWIQILASAIGLAGAQTRAAGVLLPAAEAAAASAPAPRLAFGVLPHITHDASTYLHNPLPWQQLKV